MKLKVGMALTPVTLRELADIVGALSTQGDEHTLVTGVCVDNREIGQGDAFVAFVGERVDGHNFIDQAFDCGASVAIVSKPVKAGVGPVVQVGSPLEAIQRLATHERSGFAGPVIGITGSNGKTSTKEMVAAVLGQLGDCLYTQANRNNELGLPLTILQRTPKHRSIVLEMGMRGFGQISDLCEIARPTIGVITNIGHSHIEILGSQEGIAKAKAELLESLGSDGTAILNVDDPWLRKVATLSKAPVLWYGLSPSADVYATHVEWGKEGMAFTVHVQGKSQRVTLPTFGMHNVQNALAAVAAGTAVGLSLAQIADGLASLQPLSGRLRLLDAPREVTVIDDCYNASPLSMGASLQVLAQLAAPGRRVAILGDMYELGDYTEEGHRQVGALAAKAGVDTLICIGPAATWIAEEANSQRLPEVHHVSSVEQAIARCSEWVRAGSTVLVKASRGMQLERVVNHLLTGTTEQK
ncbi:UDP-N-acetylmuramoyl-tripeptide--D-alanyl-D-alanine ligase [Alicyclobacillus fastidiosus]|uniref:UDP-N-acetylmuramoyl-tripeptide--D-alanyl-D-alanine ligase n=1 Tax=Alicyclobacillus fastidiosus TaxID=392011 RepID=A0ABY6ZC68_9BACL|nr:UDP-N-acetylmuramoyl-tripeptide--D-alanyl-D-alanine ligase [Alicyclobacillus fastidiosus]WAH39695.1 UDP-N-acetylmuramoyl-tripeptide--D-alanyl-D-alanine ligase [Alicyclobacillus fastidiosus]GMA60911.1 UDP-N-acetylmuramoyl-tripeptide--D-alanyl-D-alanine ligase [Alicyclobacillus fastidiosus]